jgi:hypothetical protein
VSLPGVAGTTTGNVQRSRRLTAIDELVVLINEGGFRFRQHRVAIRDSKLTPENFDGRAQVPNLADFNGDGWLDIAIGCDNIGNAMGGVPLSRLYVFRPRRARTLTLRVEQPEKRLDSASQATVFDEGTLEDLGGSDLIPDFGGFYHDTAKDKAGPNLALRDLDGDGDLDLVQSCHIDLRELLLPYSPGEYRQGVLCWKNVVHETDATSFKKVTGNGLVVEARLKYNRETQVYENATDAKAPGLPYLFFTDVDNDGQQDALAIGPSDPNWSPRTEDVGGRFWKNLGGFRFEERTDAAELASLN